MVAAEATSVWLRQGVAVPAAVRKSQKAPDPIHVCALPDLNPDLDQPRVDVQLEQVGRTRHRPCLHWSHSDLDSLTIVVNTAEGRAVVQTGQRFRPTDRAKSSNVAKMTDRPFTEEVPRLLKERGMSIRTLAAMIGISDSHLSRVLRRADYKTPSPDLTTRVAVTLGLPPDYFREFREAYVIERIKSDPKLLNRLYSRLSVAKKRRP
jgi:plasmid maintenance system antidote protein VapI